jgi:hypothetical protein
VSQVICRQNKAVAPYSIFPDGRRLAYQELDPSGRFNTWTLRLDLTDPDHPKAGKPELFVGGGMRPAVSPDGRWIAYYSVEAGKGGLYVRPYPGPGGQWQISSGFVRFPVWSRTSRELFFEDSDGRIMVVNYEPTNDSFGPGKPRIWSDRQLTPIPGGYTNLDLAPDGKRFPIFPAVEPAVEQKGGTEGEHPRHLSAKLLRRIAAARAGWQVTSLATRAGKPLMVSILAGCRDRECRPFVQSTR